MPPADERLRHLFLAGTARTLPFTTPNRGGRRGGPPARDPESHGRALSRELARIAGAQPELAELRRDRDLEEVTGTPVTFELVLNPDFSLDKLEDKGAGIELLSFRSTGDDMGVAVVFVPEGKLAVFERKLEAYLDPDKLTKKGMRRNHQADRASESRGRAEPPPGDSPAVCLLDPGIDVGHPLLEPGLDPEDAHSYDEANWGVDDHQGHGTQMGGFALYGADLDRL